jgi:hypothetical protein
MKLQPGPVRSDRPFHLANEKYGIGSIKQALDSGMITAGKTRTDHFKDPQNPASVVYKKKNLG